MSGKPLVRSTRSRFHSMPFGTVFGANAITFRLWAPTASAVDLCLIKNNVETIVAMPAGSDGWYEVDESTARPGDRYAFRIDGNLKVPDPVSRYQPEDVHQFSEIIDPRQFVWTDVDWSGRRWEEAIIYELHPGTFTTEGTFKAAKEKLPYLKDLGITAIELMPIADFPGSRNWGYDGVLPFAPDSTYGRPEDLKDFIQRAHELDLMVILDVVYNHFGPDGNYLYVYARPFFTDKYKTPWGDAINFEEKYNETVRSYFINNALYWLNEYNFDGLRFDAVHAIYDSHQRSFLKQLAHQIHEHIPPHRHVHLILENDGNESDLLRNDLFTAQWNDDFHHVFHVLTTGETTGYYSDYSKPPALKSNMELVARVLTGGFAYQADPSPLRDGEIRGQLTAGLRYSAFVGFLQNHDQIGNRALGDRLASLCGPGPLRAVFTILFLNPQIPMLFMGEEWASITPFLFFCDLSSDLAPLITEGRRSEFASFPQFSDPAKREQIPDPCLLSTFERSRLNWDDISNPEYCRWIDLVKKLISLRNAFVVPMLIDGLKTDDAVFEVGHGVHAGLISISWRGSQSKSHLHMVANLSSDAVDSIPNSFLPKGSLVFDCATESAVLDKPDLAPQPQIAPRQSKNVLSGRTKTGRAEGGVSVAGLNRLEPWQVIFSIEGHD